MIRAADLRAQSEALAGPLPALLAGAERLASAVQPGLHGRRRSGPGETFWQYRLARPEDGQRGVDWRRSGRGDQLYAQQREWQVAQVVQFWVDPSKRMDFGAPLKSSRAAELALALAILAERGGERVGLAGGDPARGGAVQLGRMAEGLVSGAAGLPDASAFAAHGRAVLFSDFLGDLAPLKALVAGAAERGVRGALCQILTPDEASFPYRGRVIFEAMDGAQRHETLKADGQRAAYLTRLAKRQAALKTLASSCGWQMLVHRVDAPAADALIWLARATEAKR